MNPTCLCGAPDLYTCSGTGAVRCSQACCDYVALLDVEGISRRIEAGTQTAADLEALLAEAAAMVKVREAIEAAQADISGIDCVAEPWTAVQTLDALLDCYTINVERPDKAPVDLALAAWWSVGCPVPGLVADETGEE